MTRTLLIVPALLALACGQASSQDNAKGIVSFGTPVAAQQLSGLRGGTDTTFNDMRQHGTASGNTARNVQTGNNSITDGALASMNGIPVVIQNTGANVLIQSATIVNVQLR